MFECHIAVVGAQGNLEAKASDAVVPWWSFTKTLIAVAALRLAEQGALALDERLGGRPYTPRQLLQHRAGVGDYGGLRDYSDAVARGEAPWPESALLARVPPEELRFAPAAGWAYSNVGYLLLRRLIEARYGAGLKAALRELVLLPLGIESADLAETVDDMNASAFAGNHGYHPGWVYHGTLMGSPREAALALHRIMTGGLLAPASRAALLDRYMIGGRLPGRPWITTGYGLGLMMGDVQGDGMAAPGFVVGHSAGGPGSVGAVYHAPELCRTAAVFTGGRDEGVAENLAVQQLFSA
jgi:CubicO group peptidase (beta-lactamase class C family)